MKRHSKSPAALLLLSTAAVKLIGAIFKIPLANILGDEGFGRFSSVYDLFTPFYALAMSGLPVAVSKLYAAMPEGSDDRPRLFAVSKRLYIIFGLTAAAGFTALIPVALPLVGGGREALSALLFIAPAVFLFFPLSAYRGWYEGHNNMLPTAVSDLIEAAGKLILGLGLAAAVVKASSNSAAAAAAALLGITLGVVAAYGWIAIYSRGSAEIPKRDTATERELSCGLLRSALSIGIAAVLLSVPASLTDALTVRPLLSAGTVGFADKAQSLYGVRGRAFTLFNLVPSVTAAVGISFVPQIACAAADRDASALKTEASLAVKITLCTALPAGFGLSLLSKQIFKLLYGGSEFLYEGARLLFIYGIAAVLAGVAVPVLQMLQALGRQREVLWILIGSTAVKLVANIILVSQANINIYGAAAATGLLYFSACVPAIILLIYDVGGLTCGTFLRPAAAAAVTLLAAAGAARLFSAGFAVLLVIAIAIAVFIASAATFKVFSADELENIFGKKCIFKR